jgi:hypothetical protein
MCTRLPNFTKKSDGDSTRTRVQYQIVPEER